VIDRLPPQNLDSEQAVLGSILIDRDAIIEVADFLHPEDFYRQAHGRIYAAMLELFEHREPIDVVTVAEALERDGELEAVGGASYLSTLGNDTPTAVHVAQYGRIVERKAVLRRPDPGRRQDRRPSATRTGRTSRRRSTGRRPSCSRSASAARTTASAPCGRSSTTPTTGWTTCTPTAARSSASRPGFPDLDQLTTGFQASDLVVLAARPSVGKTSLALNIAEHAAVREGKTVGVFSLEMSKEQLVLRLLSSVASIDSQRLRSGFLEELDFARIAPAMKALSEAPIYIDDTPNISTMELRTKARRLQAEHGLDLLIVDYLQLMQATTNSRDANRVQEVSEISRGLKALARELKVPVIALSQLSRQPEMRESREPRLSDLRESGAIEQDADLVLFLWREKEKPGEDERDPTARSSTCAWPSTATAPPAKSSCGSRRARPAS
jgi:replicative DNA helicase